MNKKEFVAILRSERATLERLFDAVGIRRMDIAGVSGFYSTTDVIAHLTAYERALVNWLREANAGRAYVDSVLDQPDLDARNAVVYDASRHSSAADTVRAFHETFDELENCVSLLTDEELINPEVTAWFVVPRWQQQQEVWKCIANDSYEHHAQHIPDIERWLAENA
jgi:hypothetical protein